MKGGTSKHAKLGTTGVFSEPLDTPAVDQSPSPPPRPDRVGRMALPSWATAAAKRQLRILAAELDMTQQSLMTEALNALFQKYGKPPIA